MSIISKQQKKQPEKILLTVLCSLIFLLLTVFALPETVCAAEEKDYRIYGADFDDQSEKESKIYGYWDRPEDRTSCKVRLYKGSTLVGSTTVSGARVNLSSLIVSKKGGAGIYYFLVTPTRGTEDDGCKSEELEITSAMVSRLKAKIDADFKESKKGKGWEKGPGFIWIYYEADGTQAKNKWITVDGYKYWMDKAGIMQTGWTAISGAYYYLEPKQNGSIPFGACYVNTTTPDGHQVNEDGARIKAGTEGTVEKAITYKTLTTLVVSLKEDQNPGKHTKINTISCSSGTVSNITYSSDPETWTTESVGTVEFDVKLSETYKFGQSVRVSCSRAISASITKTGATQGHVILYYTPKFVLASPEDFYNTPEWVLRWFKVPRAASYKLKITVTTETESEGDIQVKTSTLSVETENLYYDLEPLMADESYTGIKSVTVTAVGANKKKFVDSAEGKAGDLEKLRTERTVSGYFTENGIGLKYIDEDGEQAVGWKELMGSWYYFRKTGYAAKGWLQDGSTWYYFDEKCRMQTGDVTVDGKVYHLNADPSNGIPLGAWIQ